MSLVNMKDMLNLADRYHYAVGNFDVFNVEMLNGVMEAAAEMRSPIILAFGKEFEKLMPLEEFSALAKKAAQRVDVPVALHLDHAIEFEVIMRALKAGFTSVMIDASYKSLEDNIAATRKIAEICREFSVSVEAELGHVGGLDCYESSAYEESYTVVKEAEYFVKETGIDALAVAIGTVHGVYKSKPRLNISRLLELKEALKMPLVLHGGSGLNDEELSSCVDNGINKVNIFTDLTLAAMEQMKQDAELDLSYLEKCMRIRAAVKEIAKQRMQILRSEGKADRI